MKITTVNIPQSEIDNGLKPVSMRGLGRVVLIAGKNGSGKSRLLDLVESTLLRKQAVRFDSEEKYMQKKHELEDLSELINELTMNYKPSLSEKEKTEYLNGLQYRIEQRNKIQLEIQRHDQSAVQDQDFIITDTLLEPIDASGNTASDTEYLVHRLVPKISELVDCNELTRRQLQTNAAGVDRIGIANLHTGTFARIQAIEDRWMAATHPKTPMREPERARCIADYESLREIVKQIIGDDLGRSNGGDATIFGLALGKSKLSPGQQVLLQLCVAFHCQGRTLADKIVFLDEPENHLHPSVVIDVIDRFAKLMPEGQIWIATHSIEVLSYFGSSNIWLMDQGEVSYVGAAPNKVVSGLVGNEEAVMRLQDFLTLPNELAFNRFALECLFPAYAVTTGAADDQVRQVQDNLAPVFRDRENARILDWGAGTGRMLRGIWELRTKKPDQVPAQIDYVALDHDETNVNICRDLLKECYPDDKRPRAFQRESEIKNHYDPNSFDVVIMCNVLHEIDPETWLGLFSADGDLRQLLSRNGHLLIVEDEMPRRGEKAHKNGYLVLDTPELMTLFGVRKRSNKFRVDDQRDDGRLKAHWLHYSELKKVTARSRRDALRQLKHKAEARLRELRVLDKPMYRDGRQYAFWLQQYANAALFLDEKESK